jgi:hypothetical protein
MGQTGHTDPKFTLKVYARAMQRRGDERDRLRALVGGAGVGTPTAATAVV